MKLNETDRMIKWEGNRTGIITIDEQNVGNNNNNNNNKEMNPCRYSFSFFFGLLISFFFCFFTIIFHLSSFCVRFVYAEFSFFFIVIVKLLVHIFRFSADTIVMSSSTRAHAGFLWNFCLNAFALNTVLFFLIWCANLCFVLIDFYAHLSYYIH